MPPVGSQQALINALLASSKAVNLATAAIHVGTEIVEKSYQNLHTYAGYSAGGIQAKVVEQIGDLNRKMRVSEATSTTMQDFVQASQRIKNAFEPLNTGFINITNKLSTLLLNATASIVEKFSGVKPEDIEKSNLQKFAKFSDPLFRMAGMGGVGDEPEFRARRIRRLEDMNIRPGGGLRSVGVGPPEGGAERTQPRSRGGFEKWWEQLTRPPGSPEPKLEKLKPLPGGIRAHRADTAKDDAGGGFFGRPDHPPDWFRFLPGVAPRMKEFEEESKKIKGDRGKGMADLANRLLNAKGHLRTPEDDRMKGRLDFGRRQAEAVRAGARRRVAAMTPTQRAAYKNSAQKLAEQKAAMARKSEEARKGRLQQILAWEKTRIPMREIDYREKLIKEFDRQRRPLAARERRTMEGQKRRGQVVKSPLSNREKTQLNILNDIINRNQSEIDEMRRTRDLPKTADQREREKIEQQMKREDDLFKSKMGKIDENQRVQMDKRDEKLTKIQEEVNSTKVTLDNRLKRMQQDGMNVRITNLNRWRLTPRGMFALVPMA